MSYPTYSDLELEIQQLEEENKKLKEDNKRLREWVDAGQKLVEATWKDANLWVLTAPMDSTYKPQTLILKEYSEFGVLEGEIKFIESRYIPNE